MNTSRFTFENFDPSEEIQLYSRTMFDQLAHTLPSGWLITARMVSTPNHYHCFCQLKSSRENIIVDSKNSDPILAIDVLDQSIRKKITVLEQSDRFIESSPLYHTDVR